MNDAAALGIRVALTILWTLATASGTVAAFGNMQDARVDRRNLLRRVPRINGILRIEADGGVDDQRAIFVALLMDFVTGAISLANVLVIASPAPSAPTTIAQSVFGSLAAIMLTTGAFALVRLSFAKKKRRRIQIAYLLRTYDLPQQPTRRPNAGQAGESSGNV